MHNNTIAHCVLYVPDRHNSINLSPSLRHFKCVDTRCYLHTFEHISIQFLAQLATWSISLSSSSHFIVPGKSARSTIIIITDSASRFVFNHDIHVARRGKGAPRKQSPPPHTRHVYPSVCRRLIWSEYARSEIRRHGIFSAFVSAAQHTFVCEPDILTPLAITILCCIHERKYVNLTFYGVWSATSHCDYESTREKYNAIKKLHLCGFSLFVYICLRINCLFYNVKQLGFLYKIKPN